MTDTKGDDFIPIPPSPSVNQTRYVGEQNEHGVPHGFGSLFEGSRIIYKGQFQSGEPHGEGIYYFPTGVTKYKGAVAFGKYCGFGRQYYPSGELRFEGYIFGSDHYGSHFHENGDVDRIGRFECIAHFLRLRDGLMMFYIPGETLVYEFGNGIMGGVVKKIPPDSN